jgi:hypothetical protein
MKNYHTHLSKKLTISIITFILVLIISINVFGAPVLPSSYYGNAEINGRAAPVNSKITAFVQGVQKGSIVISEQGEYGGPETFDEVLVVHDGEDGDTVTFYIQTPTMSNTLKADQNASWLAGEKQELNLTFNGLEEIKTEPEEEKDTGSSSSSGGPVVVSGSGNETVNETQPEAEDIEVVYEDESQKNNYDLNEIITLGEDVESKKGDVFQYNFQDKVYNIETKAIGPFSAIFGVSGEELIIAKGDSKTFDFNNDGQNDLSITLNSIEQDKVVLSFKSFKQNLLEELDSKVDQEGSNAITGMATFVSENSSMIGLLVILIIVLIVIFYFSFKKSN